MGNWDDLPGDMLAVIGDHLDVYTDYVRFRAVCASCRSSLPKWPKHFYYNIPWLMFPCDDDEKLQGFYGPLDDEVYYLELPELGANTNCRGSADGWIVILENGLTLKLLNPLTKSQIQLPPIYSFPDIIEYNPNRHGAEYTDLLHNGERDYLSYANVHEEYIFKIVLSSNYFIAVAIYSEHAKLAFCKFGDDRWTNIIPTQMSFQDCIFFDGKIYAINARGDIMVSPIHTPTHLVKLHIAKPKLKSGHLYLVKTDDELLVVERILDFVGDIIYNSVEFNLYKLDLINNRWLKINSLHDYTIFLGLNTSICVPSTYCSKLKGNHIYYTDNLMDFQTPNYVGGHDFGVFNISDGSFQSILYKERPSRLLFWPHPMWVVLNPC